MKQFEIKSNKTGQVLTVPEKQFESVYKYKDFIKINEIPDAGPDVKTPPVKTIPGKQVTTANRTVPAKTEKVNDVSGEVSAESIAASLELTDAKPQGTPPSPPKAETKPQTAPPAKKASSASKTRNAGKS